MSKRNHRPRRSMGKKWHPMPQHKDKDGYLYVVMEDEHGDRSVAYVHDLVAKAFIPNPHGKQKVRHKDGCITNNQASNLEWCD
jgi:hypothetical protein